MSPLASLSLRFHKRERQLLVNIVEYRCLATALQHEEGETTRHPSKQASDRGPRECRARSCAPSWPRLQAVERRALGRHSHRLRCCCKTGRAPRFPISRPTTYGRKLAGDARTTSGRDQGSPWPCLDQYDDALCSSLPCPPALLRRELGRTDARDRAA